MAKNQELSNIQKAYAVKSDDGEEPIKTQETIIMIKKVFYS